MPISGGKEEAVRQQAMIWSERMRGPDKDRLHDDFEKWRNSDPGHAAAYARFEQQWALAGGLRATAMGAARAGVPLKQRWISARSIPQMAFASAAMAVLLVMISVHVFRTADRPPESAAVSGPVSTAVGQIRQARLADGSMIVLDTDSVIDIVYTKSTRIVRLLRGRGRFDVAHDAARPFIVEAAGETLTAKGTVFDVCAYGSTFRVSLLRGTIDVGYGTAARPLPGPVAHLLTGQSLRAGGDGVPDEVGQVVQGEDHWVAGMLTFDGATLRDVIEQTNRYSTTKIRLGEASLKTLRVTGTFRPLPVKDLAASLAATFELRIEHAANGDILLFPR